MLASPVLRKHTDAVRFDVTSPAHVMWDMWAGFAGMSGEDYNGNIGPGGACNEGAAG